MEAGVKASYEFLTMEQLTEKARKLVEPIYLARRQYFKGEWNGC